jgi:hypothetical protein
MHLDGLKMDRVHDDNYDNIATLGQFGDSFNDILREVIRPKREEWRSGL